MTRSYSLTDFPNFYRDGLLCAVEVFCAVFGLVLPSKADAPVVD